MFSRQTPIFYRSTFGKSTLGYHEQTAGGLQKLVDSSEILLTTCDVQDSGNSGDDLWLMFPLPVTLGNAGWQKSSIENVIILVVTFTGRGSISRDNYLFYLVEDVFRLHLNWPGAFQPLELHSYLQNVHKKFREPQIFPFTKPNHASMESFTKLWGPTLRPPNYPGKYHIFVMLFFFVLLPVLIFARPINPHQIKAIHG